jgi:predicted DCC family thiol-disulfide oxidoreductase YuxK
MSTNIQPIFTKPEFALLPLTVFYDHSCILCRSEIEHLAARDHDQQLKMVDCSGAHFDCTNLPFSQATLLASIHAMDAKGEWLRATDVFVVCYRTAQLQSIAKLFAFAKPVLEKIYPWIARNRHVFSWLGVHQLFIWLTNRHTLLQAKKALSQSQACQDADCDIKPSNRAE